MKEQCQRKNKQKVYKQLSYFDPLVSFANEDLRKENWKEILWKAMGDKRFSRVTYTVNGKTTEETILHLDINFHLTEKLGFEWYFPVEKEQEFIRKIGEAIKEVKPDIPTVFGQEPTFELVKELQKKIKQILDVLVITRPAEQHWIQISGQEFNYWGLPPHISNIEHYEKISKMIHSEFGEMETRTAIVSSINGFICFNDMDKDASRTLSWMLSGLVNTVFKKELVALKNCLWCKKYFIHMTRHNKKYCSDNCRYDDHNKGSNYKKIGGSAWNN